MHTLIYAIGITVAVIAAAFIGWLLLRVLWVVLRATGAGLHGFAVALRGNEQRTAELRARYKT